MRRAMLLGGAALITLSFTGWAYTSSLERLHAYRAMLGGEPLTHYAEIQRDKASRFIEEKLREQDLPGLMTRFLAPVYTLSALEEAVREKERALRVEYEHAERVLKTFIPVIHEAYAQKPMLSEVDVVEAEHALEAYVNAIREDEESIRDYYTARERIAGMLSHLYATGVFAGFGLLGLAGIIRDEKNPSK